MTVDTDWEAAFLAVSTLLGEAPEVAASSLPDRGAAAMAGSFGSSARGARAAAAARTVAALLSELESARLA